MTSNTKRFAALRMPKQPERSRADILRAATKEFATRGLDGASLDAIARRTRTTRAMIYYYFRRKEGLYLAVLENAYRGIREAARPFGGIAGASDSASGCVHLQLLSGAP